MAKIPKALSAGEEELALHLGIYKVPFEREYHFAKDDGRKWRADFAVVGRKILIEVEGGTMTGGRHTRGRGFEDDCLKYNYATLHGWAVYRFTSAMVRSGVAIDTITAALA